jgi:hypothetical protein
MPEWNPQELQQAARIAQAIEASPVPRRRPPPNGDIYLRLSEFEPLREGLASTLRALPVRQLCRALRFDEGHAFNWRLEHKLVQALIVNHYLPGLVPVTQGLGRLARRYGAAGLSNGLKQEFPSGLYIKPALGDSSGERPQKDVTCQYLAAISEGRQDFTTTSDLIAEEEIVVQDRLFIEKEYRVHTLEDQVIEDLTFLRYGRGNIPGERDRPNEWVRPLLQALPAALVGQSLLGWDIAMDAKGGMRVVEMNFTGFHPVHRRGFQCSGFYQDPEWGASMTARLLRFLEKSDGVTVHIELDVDELPERLFHSNVARWLNMLRSGEAK